MQNLARIIITLGFVTCVSLIPLEKTNANTLLKEEKEGTYLSLNRFTKQEEVQALELVPNLFSISVKDVSIDARSIFLQELPTVRKLHFTNIPFLEQLIKIVSENMPNLEVLNLSGSGLKSESLLELSKLRKLRVLDLSDTYLTDKQHLDSLLEANTNMVVYVESLLDHPFSSINMDVYNGNTRIINRKYTPPNK